jgi:hypothetical protein
VVPNATGDFLTSLIEILWFCVLAALFRSTGLASVNDVCVLVDDADEY